MIINLTNKDLITTLQIIDYQYIVNFARIKPLKLGVKFIFLECLNGPKITEKVIGERTSQN